MSKLKIFCFLLYFLTARSYGVGCPQTILYGDLKNDGGQEKIVLNLQKLGFGCEFHGLSVLDQNDHVIYEFPKLEFQDLAFLNKVVIERMRNANKNQLLIDVSSNASLKMAKASLVEWNGSGFVETFSSNDHTSIEIQDLNSDNNKEIIVYWRTWPPDVYSFDSASQKYIKSNSRFIQFYEDFLKSSLSKKYLNKNGYLLYQAMQTAYFLKKYDVLRFVEKIYFENFFCDGSLKKERIVWEGLPSEEQMAQNFLEWAKYRKDQSNSLKSYCSLPSDCINLWTGLFDILKYYKIKLGLKGLGIDDSKYDEELNH